MDGTQRSNFQLVSDMNAAFGNPKGDPNKIDGNRLLSQCKNIVKEFEELMAAINEGNIYKIRDALCDIHVFTYGAHHFMGIDADRDMAAVVSALFSRFCSTPEQLKKTCEHFDAMGVNFYVEGDYPTICLKSSMDQGFTEGSDKPEYPKGKFLKAVGYTEPVFYEPAPTLQKPVVIERKFFGQELSKAVIEDMAEQRVKHEATMEQKVKAINRQVEEYRTQLEREVFGFPAYDSNLNNAGSFNPPQGA